MQSRLKVLNLYAGLGGNRKLWKNVDVTAVENNSSIAYIYGDFYPDDEVVVADAHEYLINNFREYDFIWSSPPCPTHSQIRYNIGYKADRRYEKVKPIYPDMALYQEIILLQHWAEGIYWVVENTIPYYTPLIEGSVVANHLWWSNFEISDIEMGNRGHRGGTVESLQQLKGIDITGYKIKKKRKLLRNCVQPELGEHVLECARMAMDIREEIIGAGAG